MEQTWFFHSFHNYLLSVKGLRVRWQKKKSRKEGEALYQSVIFSTFQPLADNTHVTCTFILNQKKETKK